MTGLSTKMWLLMESFLSEDCFSPLFWILNLCGAVRFGTSPLHFNVHLSACFCHISAKKRNQEIFTSLLTTINISITEHLIKGGKNVKEGEKRSSPSICFMLPNCCQKLT